MDMVTRLQHYMFTDDECTIHTKCNMKPLQAKQY